jgi:hypothetical protein
MIGWLGVILRVLTLKPCQFVRLDNDEWWCETHGIIMIQKDEPTLCSDRR